MKTRKKIIIILLLLIPILLVLSYLFTALSIYINDYNTAQGKSILSHTMDFADLRDALEICAKKQRSLFDEEKKKNENLWHIAVEDAHVENTWILHCYSTDDAPVYEIEITVTPEEDMAFTVINREKYQKWHTGEVAPNRVTEDKVVFECSADYSLVYMNNRTRPKYVLSEDENYIFKGITPAWYDPLNVWSSKWYHAFRF
jgi:hypothetical protein